MHREFPVWVFRSRDRVRLDGSTVSEGKESTHDNTSRQCHFRCRHNRSEEQ